MRVGACVCMRVDVMAYVWKRACVWYVQFSRREHADSLVLQVCGSLLLMDVWAIAQTECDVRVVRWTEAVLSEPAVCPCRGGGAT